MAETKRQKIPQRVRLQGALSAEKVTLNKRNLLLTTPISEALRERRGKFFKPTCS